MSHKPWVLINAPAMAFLSAALSTSTPPASRLNVAHWDTRAIRGASLALPGWIKVNTPGFGEPRTTGVIALQPVNNRL